MDAIERRAAPTGEGAGGGAGGNVKAGYKNPITTHQKIKENIIAALAGAIAIPFLIIMMPVVFIVAAFYGREVAR